MTWQESEAREARVCQRFEEEKRRQIALGASEEEAIEAAGRWIEQIEETEAALWAPSTYAIWPEQT